MLVGMVGFRYGRFPVRQVSDIAGFSHLLAAWVNPSERGGINGVFLGLENLLGGIFRGQSLLEWILVTTRTGSYKAIRHNGMVEKTEQYVGHNPPPPFPLNNLEIEFLVRTSIST